MNTTPREPRILQDQPAYESTEAAADRQAGLAPADVSRRKLLRSLFLGLGAAALPTWVVKKAHAQSDELGGPELEMPFGPLGAQDYGPLVQQVVTDNLTGVNHQLYAPAGFDVRVVMRAGVNPVTNTVAGTLGHVNPDGGAVYLAPDGGWVYVSNSETGAGSVSSVRFDATGAVVDYYRICTGTRTNCAGGQTPWGTWITCEETNGGWAFECDPFGSPATQRRLDALGARNGREAVAIDPINFVCYQTLDNSAGKFVRFVSDVSDLETTVDGVIRMRMETGVSQRLFIPEYNGMPAYNNAVVPNNATSSALLRPARPIQWVADTGNNGTNFNGGEGIWYYEVPEEFRVVPTAGSVPTRGVIFFTSKGDNRVWAIDIENNLLELIYDTQNNQAFTNLRNANGTLSNYNQVDNCVVSPAGDVLVAEDGTAMRLAIVENNQRPKLLLQITTGNSEICGPAFSPDGSKLYFSSQRGPSGPTGTGAAGVIYEMTIPAQFRTVQRAEPFFFEEQLTVAPGMIVTSEMVTLLGFLGALQLSISPGNNAEFAIDDGPWQTAPVVVYAGDSVRVRHLSSTTIGDVNETTVKVGLANGASETLSTFISVTSEPDQIPDPFEFPTRVDVPPNTMIESDAVTLTGFNLPVEVLPQAGTEYRIHGGSWKKKRGTLQPGHTLQVRQWSSDTCKAARTMSITVGGVRGGFTAITQ